MNARLVRGLRRIVDSLQRGLFDDAEQAPPPVASPPRPPVPLETPADALPRHPRATRELVVDGVTIAFLFARSKRRSIGFVVDADGLSVRAPKWVSLRDVDAAVREKGRWIVARLDEQRERARQQAAALLDGDAASPPRLRVGLPGDAGEERVKDAVQSWLQREARRIFAARAAHFAERLGVKVRRLSLSSAKTRWGSANANGSVRLHWRLIPHPLATIDYVVAHELAHLREMNHSERFWNVVRSVVPEYEAARKELRRSEQSPRSGA